MLFEVQEPDLIKRQWVGRSLPRRVMWHWLIQGAAPDVQQPRWYTDCLTSPSVMLRLRAADCVVHGPARWVESALHDLFCGRILGDSAWPDGDAHEAWEAAGRRELQLERVLPSTLASALRAGFRAVPEEPQPYYRARAWYMLGAPRFADEMEHPCRVVEGEELLQLFSQGTPRRDLDYYRECLRQGPSFVCEQGGKAVCWSLTHLGGALGAIYTPPEERGKGYARSLSALQLDSVLAARGIAVASIRVDNEPSYRLFERRGGRHLRQALTWSTLTW